MISIQDVGTEIFENKPRKLYVFCGESYGIKFKYLQHLKMCYNGNYEEVESVSSVIDFMSKKQILPPVPKLYIVRYDEKFLSDLNQKYAEKVLNTNIIGTIVCLYSAEKHCKKADKFLPDNTVVIPEVSKTLIFKYLKDEYTIDDGLISLAVSWSKQDYFKARLLCDIFSNIPSNEWGTMAESDLQKVVTLPDKSTTDDIKTGVLQKNFYYLVKKYQTFTDTDDAILYAILSELLTIEKSRGTRYLRNDSPEKAWSNADICNMFMQTYKVLSDLRDGLITNSKCAIVYLFGLLQYDKIPSVEMMS